MKTAELLVRCLENEGAQFFFGPPVKKPWNAGMPCVDSRIRFIETRHEPGAAFMADVHGRLSGRAGGWLSTPGPGATNLLHAD